MRLRLVTTRRLLADLVHPSEFTSQDVNGEGEGICNPSGEDHREDEEHLEAIIGCRQSKIWIVHDGEEQLNHRIWYLQMMDLSVFPDLQTLDKLSNVASCHSIRLRYK
jgi:hypothetical protein